MRIKFGNQLNMQIPYSEKELQDKEKIRLDLEKNRLELSKKGIQISFIGDC